MSGDRNSGPGPERLDEGDSDWSLINPNSNEEAATDTSDSQSSIRRRNVASSSSSSSLTPMQRKARNKAASKAASKKAAQRKEQQKGPQLINEEEEERSDLSAGESGSEDEGVSDVDSDASEADWERDDAPSKPKRGGAASSSTPSSSSSRRNWLWWIALGLVAGLIWIRIQDESLLLGVDPDDIDMSTRPPGEHEDYYATLGLGRQADIKQIKASYRKLVLKTHPDKNPGCTDCITKFQLVQKAYDVLSHPEKRALYDSIELSYDPIQSEAVELTSDTFTSQVLQRDDVWVIQVYTDWHRSAIRFAQAWEEAIQRSGHTVRFGRVHAHRERELARTLPIKFGVIPTVLIYANGRFVASKTFLDDSHTALSKLMNFIADNYPNAVTSVGNQASAIRSFINQANEDRATVLLVPDFVKNEQQTKRRQRAAMVAAHAAGGSHAQRFQQQMLQTDTQLINHPSLTYKSIARQFQPAIQFGQVQQIKEPQAWRTWIKEISQQFKLSPPRELPALLYREPADASPLWLSGNLKRDKLIKHVSYIHRRKVPWLDSVSYARHCTQSPSNPHAICVLALACPTHRSRGVDFNSFTTNAYAWMKQPSFRREPFQFAKVDITKQPDMRALCDVLPEESRAFDMNYVVVKQSDSEKELHYSPLPVHAQFPFHDWLPATLGDGGAMLVWFTSVPAPSIPVVHVPDDVWLVHLPVAGPIQVPLRWLYACGIVISFIVFFPLISQHFGKFLYFIFAMSIVVPAFELIKDVYDKQYG